MKKYYSHYNILSINLETNKEKISDLAVLREEENEAFRSFLNHRDRYDIDNMVHDINLKVEPLIDCTHCGACCKGLMINVTKNETEDIAKHLNITTEHFTEKYIEESAGGMMIMNTIPCHFLEDKKCSVYEHRFSECRDFPHLHKPNFNDRLFATLIHYSICPIIFNVVEELKIKTNFFKQKEA